VELAGDVSSAAAEDDAATAARVAGDALALWRGPALAGVALGTAGRADAERLEELRLRVLEQDVDAELGLGRHEAVVGELQALVGQNPYRERFVAQLMLALYRSGRHADALDVYERTRIALDDELGLQPSAELQQLSGRIVRQDPELRRPPPVAKRVPGRPVGERKRSVADFSAQARRRSLPWR
jgi:tetratricopeptide (TPR) repeat protein